MTNLKRFTKITTQVVPVASGSLAGVGLGFALGGPVGAIIGFGGGMILAGAVSLAVTTGDRPPPAPQTRTLQLRATPPQQSKTPYFAGQCQNHGAYVQLAARCPI